MTAREFLDQNKPAVIGVTSVIALLAFAYIAWSFATSGNRTPPANEPLAYFYDLHTGELFHAPANTIGPIERPGGPINGHPAGVRAQVFACGQCSDASARFIGWLEIDGPSIGKQPASDEDETFYMRRVEDTEWVSSESPDSQRITNEAMQRCEGTRANFCRPEHEESL